MYNNTSIIQDEVLSHRLGLIPLRADPRKFDWYREENDDKSKDNSKDINTSPANYGNETNSLEFELKVKCKKNPEAKKSTTETDDLYIDSCIYTDHMKWLPRKGQVQALSGKFSIQSFELEICYIMERNILTITLLICQIRFLLTRKLIVASYCTLSGALFPFCIGASA